MRKNVASQVIGAQMVSATDGSAFTGSVTVYVTGDAGTQAVGSVGSGACTHEGNGFHTYAPAQAETNYDHVAFTFTGSGAVPATVQVYTSFPQTGDSFARLGAPAGASVSADVAAVKTQTAAIEVDTADIQSRIPAALVSGRMDASVGAMAAGVLTATAIAADAITDAKVAADVTIASVTGAVGSVTGNVGGNVVGSVGSVTGLTNSTIADQVWDEALSGHLTAGSTGEALNAAGAAGDPWTTTLPGAYGAGSAGYIIGTNINATISSRMASYTQPTGFLAATFPTTVASTTNISAGTITTVTNLTNAPTAGDFTATMKTSIGTAVAASAVASVTGNVGGNVAGSVGSLAAQAKADVNAEVLDVLNTDTFAEPGQEAPGATISLAKKIGFLYKAFRNRVTQTATTYSLYNDDASTVDQKATVADNGTTFSRTEISSGP